MNHRIFERELRFRVFPGACLFECRFEPHPSGRPRARELAVEVGASRILWSSVSPERRWDAFERATHSDVTAMCIIGGVCSCDMSLFFRSCAVVPLSGRERADSGLLGVFVDWMCVLALVP